MMLKNSLKAILVMLAALLLHKTAFADEVIELPQEELAHESVLPIFDKSVSVKNRNVVTEKKIDANLYYGMALTEPIANVSKIGLSGYYNWTEDHAFGLLYEKNFSGTSTYANQLKNQFSLDFSRAPMPDSTLMFDYNIKAFYGKLSLSKSVVLNTILFASASLGAVSYKLDVTKTYPALALGVGQKFYFNKNWALRFDLRLYGNNAPVPFLNNALRPGDTVPTYSQFKERFTLTTNLDAGVSYLF
jgi:outer membrane beta-barrel protein